jgi:hypothetical protein
VPLASPPLRPPIAYPVTLSFLFIISSSVARYIGLTISPIVPWLPRPEGQQSNSALYEFLRQKTSSGLNVGGVPTSSSCIMMSAPMACCIEMLSSGYCQWMRIPCAWDRKMLTVNMVGSPVNGLSNIAPSSVMVVNLLKETS